MCPIIKGISCFNWQPLFSGIQKMMYLIISDILDLMKYETYAQWRF